MAGIVGQEYELDTVSEEDDAGVLDLQPVVGNVDDAPDHQIAARRRAMIKYIREGASPDRVAHVFGLDNWKEDPALSELVTRAEAAFICEMEIAAAQEYRKYHKLAAGIKFLLEARAGYTTRKGDDEAPQDVRINRTVVPGAIDPPHEQT